MFIIYFNYNELLGFFQSSEVKELEKKLSDTESHLSRVQKEKAEMENRDEHDSSTAATAAALHHTVCVNYHSGFFISETNQFCLKT